jgi:phosphoribosylformylglycinamidine (FGAM) synthase PurS component
MIQLKKDLYARLSISAQKDRVSNFKFKVPKDRHEMSKKSLDDKLKKASGVENIVLEHPPLQAPDAPINTDSKPAIIKNIRVRQEKVDEKVEKMLNNPVIAQLKAELIFAEELLKKIKEDDAHNPKIHSIEQNILKLKMVLEDKSYV